jgi:hypothetical protein
VPARGRIEDPRLGKHQPVIDAADFIMTGDHELAIKPAYDQFLKRPRSRPWSRN